MTKIKRYNKKKTLQEEAAAFNVDLDESRLSAKETKKLFKMGNLAIHNNNFPLAAKHFFKAWEADNENLYLLTVVSHLLSKLGHQAIAIEFLEKAIELHGVTEEICKVMGDMALSLEMYDVAERVFGHAAQFNPSEEKYYINIASALEGQGKTDDAIAFMQEVVKVLSESSDCWCMLATLLNNYRGWPDFIKPFEKALAINPNNIVALNNYARAMHLEPIVEELTERAIKLKPDLAEPHVSLSTFLKSHGRLKEAWPHYEYRNDPSRGPMQTVQYTHGIKRWEAQSLKGKVIFLASEQGLGDELYFATGFKHFLDSGAKVLVGCDARLVEIYERSFPNIKAYAHQDLVVKGIRYRSFPELEKSMKLGATYVDYALPIGSIPLHFWNDLQMVPQYENGYLKADPDLSKSFKGRINSISEKPKIGISWRSGHIDVSRNAAYIGLENLLPLIKEIDAEFISLQYDCTEEERALIQSKTGKSLHIWSEIDLKQNIEANLAIMDNLDVVLGPGIATQMMAFAVGCETWQLEWSRPWWNFGQSYENTIVHHAPKSKYWDKGGLNFPWSSLVDKVIPALKERLHNE